MCPAPKLRIQEPKKATGGGLPGPPKIETHLAQRLERRWQGRSHIVSLKSLHANTPGEAKRQLIKKSSSGKSHPNVRSKFHDLIALRSSAPNLQHSGHAHHRFRVFLSII